MVERIRKILVNGESWDDYEEYIRSLDSGETFTIEVDTNKTTYNRSFHDPEEALEWIDNLL